MRTVSKRCPSGPCVLNWAGGHQRKICSYIRILPKAMSWLLGSTATAPDPVKSEYLPITSVLSLTGTHPKGWLHTCEPHCSEHTWGATTGTGMGGVGGFPWIGGGVRGDEGSGTLSAPKTWIWCPLCQEKSRKLRRIPENTHVQGVTDGGNPLRGGPAPGETEETGKEGGVRSQGSGCFLEAEMVAER